MLNRSVFNTTMALLVVHIQGRNLKEEVVTKGLGDLVEQRMERANIEPELYPQARVVFFSEEVKENKVVLVRKEPQEQNVSEDQKDEKSVVEVEEPVEIYYGSDEAKKQPSLRRVRIDTKEECLAINRSWHETHFRCMRVCKAPRNDYKFDRRKFRCFKKTPLTIQTQQRVCAQGKIWDTKIYKCVKRAPLAQHIQLQDSGNISKRCLEGKYLRKVGRKNRFLFNQCTKSNFKAQNCHKCYTIKQRKCKKMGRVWKRNPKDCIKSETSSCINLDKKVARMMSKMEKPCKSKKCERWLGAIKKYVKSQHSKYVRKCLKGCSKCAETCENKQQNVFDAEGVCRLPTESESQDEHMVTISRSLI